MGGYDHHMHIDKGANVQHETCPTLGFECVRPYPKLGSKVKSLTNLATKIIKMLLVFILLYTKFFWKFQT